MAAKLALASDMDTYGMPINKFFSFDDLGLTEDVTIFNNQTLTP